jgi:hypothetical protein
MQFGCGGRRKATQAPTASICIAEPLTSHLILHFTRFPPTILPSHNIVKYASYNSCFYVRYIEYEGKATNTFLHLRETRQLLQWMEILFGAISAVVLGKVTIRTPFSKLALMSSSC